MTSLLTSDSDTRTDASNGSEQEAFTGTSAGIALFRYLVGSLLSCPASKKSELRRAVEEYMLRAREPFAYFDELLDVCAASAETDRLNTAIDVLSAAGEPVLKYAWSYLVRDVKEWNQHSDRAYRPNDDHWYVILRAVARCDSDEDVRFRFISMCRNAAHRGIMEGIVEALGDLATEKAKSLLSTIAKSHEDLFIRDLASDVLADME